MTEITRWVCEPERSEIGKTSQPHGRTRMPVHAIVTHLQNRSDTYMNL